MQQKSILTVILLLVFVSMVCANPPVGERTLWAGNANVLGNFTAYGGIGINADAFSATDTITAATLILGASSIPINIPVAGIGQDNYVLTYDNTNDQISLEAVAASSLASLGDVVDVSETNKTVLDVLQWTGAVWDSRPVSTVVTTIDLIGDVDTTGKSDNDVLTYDLATTSWEAQAGGGGGADGKAPTFIVAATDSANGGGADYTCDGTNDESEILQAINACGAFGGWVHLLDGSYSIDAEIVIGTTPDLRITGSGNSTTLIRTFTSGSNNAVFHVQAGAIRIEISDMWITTNTTSVNTTDHGIFVATQGTNRKTYLHNLVVKNHAGNGLFIFESGVGRKRNVVVQNNLIEDVGQDGIQVNITRSSGLTDHIATQILDNTIISPGVEGIEFLSSAGGVKVSRNHIESPGGKGIDIAAGDYSIFENNHVLDSTGIGIDLVATSLRTNLCNGNIVLSAGTDGFNLSDGPWLITNNIAFNAADDGFYIQGSDDIEVNGNMTRATGGDGFELQVGATNQVNFKNNISQTATGWGFLFADSVDSFYQNNTARDSTSGGFYFEDQFNCLISGNTVESGGTYGFRFFRDLDTCIVTNNQVVGTAGTTPFFFDAGSAGEITDKCVIANNGYEDTGWTNGFIYENTINDNIIIANRDPINHGDGFLIDCATVTIAVPADGLVKMPTTQFGVVDNPTFTVRISGTGTSSSALVLNNDVGLGYLSFLPFGDGNVQVAFNSYWDGTNHIAGGGVISLMRQSGDGLRFQGDGNNTAGQPASVANFAMLVDASDTEVHIGTITDYGDYTFQVVSGGDEIGNTWSLHVSSAWDESRKRWRKRQIRDIDGNPIDRTNLVKLSRPTPRFWKYELGYFMPLENEIIQSIADEGLYNATQQAILLPRRVAEEQEKENRRILAGFYDKDHYTMVAEETPDKFIVKDDNNIPIAFDGRYLQSWRTAEINRLRQTNILLINRINALEQSVFGP